MAYSSTSVSAYSSTSTRSSSPLYSTYVETPQKDSHIIDDSYRIIKRLDANECNEKIVFLVEEISSTTLQVLKLFLPKETKEFFKEVERNSMLFDSPMLIRCTGCVQAREGMPQLWISGSMYDSYSYILLPYCKNGTLIDLLLNAQDKGLKFSDNLVKHLFR